VYVSMRSGHGDMEKTYIATADILDELGIEGRGLPDLLKKSVD